LKVAHALIRYFDTHAARFDAIISGSADKEDPMQRPHVRINGDTLEEMREFWPHAQNDAHGLFLWLTGSMVNEGMLELDPTLLRVVSRTIQYLATIRFYEDADSGCWEEGRAVRASSIGTVCAGLFAWHDALHDYDHTRSHMAFELYQQGMATLNKILPFEVRVEEGVREYDAALLFLVTPLGLLVGVQTHNIMERVRTHLMGERGIKRYEGDAFWGPDYDRLSAALRTSDASEDATFRVQYAVAGKEAQWTIFDPLLAVYFAHRGREKEEYAEDMKQSAVHLNRTLAALVRTGDGTLLLPELYYHKNDTLSHNTIVPLYWAQANLLWALTSLAR
jgi:phosphorylase kinase alpha/beta subunit